MPKKFYIWTLGCQMNKNDSERIAGLLRACGFESVNKPEEGDILIINTCSVRHAAEERVVGVVHNWQALRAAKPNLVIAITGCMAGRDKDGKLKHKISGADLFFKIDDLPMLPKWLGELTGDFTSPQPSPCKGEGGGDSPLSLPRRGQGEVTSPYGVSEREDLGDYLQINPSRANTSSVFISIQTGCDNFCTYCVVPYARGRERNRPMQDILDEVRQAVVNGAKEITLLGQVVNHYRSKIEDLRIMNKDNPFRPVILSESEGSLKLRARRDSSATPQNDKRRGDDFAALLWEINQIPGDFRIHFTAADPQYFNDEQIEALKLPKQVNYLHLPVQSGDNEILKKMNRKYTREQYIELVKKIRAAVPDIALGTDIIVGFCGETDAQFERTLDLYKQCDFDISYHAMYSERTGTAAYNAARSPLSLTRRGQGEVNSFTDSVSKSVKKQRWQVLQDYMEKRTLEKNQKYAGQIVRVLVDKCESFLPLTKGELEGVAVGASATASGKPPAAPLGKGGERLVCSGNTDDLKFAQFLGTPDLVGKFVKIKITQAKTWVLRGEMII